MADVDAKVVQVGQLEVGDEHDCHSAANLRAAAGVHVSLFGNKQSSHRARPTRGSCLTRPAAFLPEAAVRCPPISRAHFPHKTLAPHRAEEAFKTASLITGCAQDEHCCLHYIRPWLQQQHSPGIVSAVLALRCSNTTVASSAQSKQSSYS